MPRRERRILEVPIVMGNGLLGDQHQEILSLFRTLDPRLRRIIMARAVEVLNEVADIKTAVQVLLRLSEQGDDAA